MIFQILDANYTYDSERNPLVQLFGTTQEGRSVTARIAGFRPYFYAGVDEGKLNEAKKNLTAMGLVVEEVERFEPIGYQTLSQEDAQDHDPRPKRGAQPEGAGARGSGHQGCLRDGYSLQKQISYRPRSRRHGMGGGHSS